VLLHGWRAWGMGLLDRISGMFAFALWDAARGELVLARDRLGEKPLHTALLPDGTLTFASEPAALLTLPGLSRALDPLAVDDYLALGYVPDPATIFAAIRRLPAAHALLLRRGESAAAAQPRRYWSPPRAASAAPADAPAELRARLQTAVRAQLMADVPLGAFLSGGVDSSAIVALAAGAVTGPLATFTIGFPGPGDERPAAAATAAQYRTAHHAEPATADYIPAAREIAALFGEPFGDHSAVPTLAVCRLARQHVTVALSGDGGDEVFAGYRRYRFHQLAEGARRLLPAGARARVFGTLARAYPQLAGAPRWLRAKATLTELSLDSAAGYYRTVCKLHAERRRALYTPAMRAALGLGAALQPLAATAAGHDPAARFAALMAECDPDDPLLAAQYADLHTYLPGDILPKVDRMAMAVSLEVRPPLLDPSLVAWGMALPARLKLAGGHGKQVLRQAMAPLLPHDLLWGKKRGFAADLAGQFRAGAALLRDRLTSTPLLDAGLLDRAAILRLVDDHEAGRADHAQALWQLLVLEGFLHAQAHPAVAATALAA
jgi:asparagine synthase (glutamine-hydrolysing)